jgi:hypothetical protein
MRMMDSVFKTTGRFGPFDPALEKCGRKRKFEMRTDVISTDASDRTVPSRSPGTAVVPGTGTSTGTIDANDLREYRMGNIYMPLLQLLSFIAFEER